MNPSLPTTSLLKKRPVQIGLALLLLIIVITLRSGKDPVAVSARAAENGLVESTVANTRAGTVKACRRSKLSMPIGGTIDQLLVKEGDRVEQGQLLLQLWNRNHAAQLEQARAALSVAESSKTEACLKAELAKRSDKRFSALEKRQLASQDQVDTTRTAAKAGASACDMATHQVDAAAATLKNQEAILELTSLRAPFAGVIAEINGEVGEYVTPSPQGIMTPPAVDIIDDSCLYVTAPIDEVDVRPVQTGMEARITLDAYRGKTLQGKLTRISPYVLEVEKQARTVDVDVQVTEKPDDVRLLVGYSADVEIIVDRRDNVLRIPTEAVQEGNRVFVVDPDSNKIIVREFKPGISNWTWTEVVGGITAGEMIVTTPDKPGLADGVKVVVEGHD